MSNNHQDIEEILNKEIYLLREILAIVSYYNEQATPDLMIQKATLSRTLQTYSQQSKKILKSLKPHDVLELQHLIAQRKSLRDSISRNLLTRRSIKYSTPQPHLHPKPFFKKTLVADEEEVQ